MYIFQVDNYEKELEEMKHMTRQEFVASLRRLVPNLLRSLANQSIYTNRLVLLLFDQ